MQKKDKNYVAPCVCVAHFSTREVLMTSVIYDSSVEGFETITNDYLWD